MTQKKFEWELNEPTINYAMNPQKIQANIEPIQLHINHPI